MTKISKEKFKNYEEIISKTTQKHQEVLKDVRERVPEEALEGIDIAIERSKEPLIGGQR